MRQGTPDSPSTWTRRYPPITIALITAVLIAVIILPSALNIPQTNPTTIAEYAPVPPEDDAPPDTKGNVSALGLGTSSSLKTGTPIPSDLGVAEGARRTNKRCVGKPLRQTEDPMAPPCVPFFEGNNFGSTWPGVTKDEIRVVLWQLIGSSGTTQCQQNDAKCSRAPRGGSFCDLDKPPNTDPGCFGDGDNYDHVYLVGVRGLIRHFNMRYQTYDRRVHVWIMNGSGFNAASRRADAAAAYDRIKPFATLGFAPDFTEAMAARKVMTFGGGGGGDFASASRFTRYAPYLWSYGPDVEHWAQGYANYVCGKLVGKPVAHAAGNDVDGRPLMQQARKYAFMYTTFNWGSLIPFREAVKPLLKQCGIEPVADAPFPNCCYVSSSTDRQSDNTYARRNVANMRDKRVTTILWFGGLETKTGFAADEQRWYPEIVIAADGGGLDGIIPGEGQNQNWWRNAWGHGTLLWQGNTPEEHPGFQACKEGDPNLTRGDCQFASTSGTFRDLFIMFKAIQSAGPRLTPHTINRGMHSIPSIQSTSPLLAACYFDHADDYSCVKDGVEMWWDGDHQSAYHQGPGCWHLTLGARRFLPGTWPPEDNVFKNEQDPCSPAVFGNAGALQANITGQPTS